LIAGRYERRPTLITSNKSLTEWAAIVQDASLAAALVDRILHHGEVFYLKGPSFRLKGRPLESELVATPAPSANGSDAAVELQHRVSGSEDAVH
jgi:IstB-like ATP binding protein